MFEVYVRERSGWEYTGSFRDIEDARKEAMDQHYQSPAHPTTEVRNELGRSIHCFDMVSDEDEEIEDPYHTD